MYFRGAKTMSQTRNDERTTYYPPGYKLPSYKARYNPAHALTDDLIERALRELNVSVGDDTFISDMEDSYLLTLNSSARSNNFNIYFILDTGFAGAHDRVWMRASFDKKENKVSLYYDDCTGEDKKDLKRLLETIFSYIENGNKKFDVNKIKTVATGAKTDKQVLVYRVISGLLKDYLEVKGIKDDEKGAAVIKSKDDTELRNNILSLIFENYKKNIGKSLNIAKGNLKKLVSQNSPSEINKAVNSLIRVLSDIA